jgi:hypothetical protein
LKRKVPRPATTRPDPSLAELTRAIRQSPALDASLKRQWLAVLPHLTLSDRVRLAAILGQVPPDQR